MTREVFHVSPADHGRWRVETESGGHTGPLFENKDDAVRYAEEKAQAAQLGQVIVHGHDGRIQFENTYAQDPHQRKG
jgi:hypothetical protein